MTQKRRLLSAAAALLAFVMLFSLVFLALEGDHDCQGEDCAVCAQIARCELLLKNLILLSGILAALQILAACRAESGKCAPVRFGPVTPVSLKVKLSD